jgi:hypothetical protein
MKEKDMKSDSYDIFTFIDEMGEKNYLDIIYLAEQEATRAERCFYHPHCGTYDSLADIRLYADTLKRFIRFMRYGVKPKGMTPELVTQLQRLRKRAFDLNQHPSA